MATKRALCYKIGSAFTIVDTLKQARHDQSIIRNSGKHSRLFSDAQGFYILATYGDGSQTKIR